MTEKSNELDAIKAELAELTDLVQAAGEPDVNDPRWARMAELNERLQAIEHQQTVWNSRQGADAVVPDTEAVARAGGLVDEAPDAMLLHTKEAHRLFLGRARDPEGRVQPIIGGKRVAAALRSIWYLSGGDNPYADWALIDVSARIDELKRHLTEAGETCARHMQAAARKGLVFSVLKSRAPVSITLGFRSPYGYMVANLIVEYDYLMRQIKTLVRKDLIDDDEGRVMIREATRRIRGVFEVPVRFERYLMREELRSLSRADWLPGASEDAVKRVAAVRAIFGECPKNVFTGAVSPRHSRRRVVLSDKELALLRAVADGALDGHGTGATNEGALL